MRIVLFGPPASGKGTQAYLLHQEFEYPHLSTGDLLRKTAQENNSWGEAVRAVPVGHFASDELMIELLKYELSKPEYEKGVILDGFPRTKDQAEKMKIMGLEMDVAIELQVDESALLKRIVNRRVHLESGRVYNLLSNPPQREGIDDITGEALTHREDDKEHMIAKRLSDYRYKTIPAIEAFKKQSKVIWLELNGMKDFKEIYQDIQQGLKVAQNIKKIAPDASGSLSFLNENLRSTDQDLKTIKPKF